MAVVLGSADDEVLIGDNYVTAHGEIEPVSTTRLGAFGSRGSDQPMFLDANRIVFVSFAQNLVAGDTNNARDVFIKDLTTRQVTLVSSTSGGTSGDGYSSDIAVAANRVAFVSGATNLVAGDTNGVGDIFLRDLSTGTLTRVSTSSAGAQANGISSGPSLSADGDRLAFTSSANNLVVIDTNGYDDIFVKTLSTGAVAKVNLSSTGAEANSLSFDAVISPDGTKVAFASYATNLVANDTNGVIDVFVKDLATGLLTRASTSSFGGQANGSSSAPVFSPDGTKLMFNSGATNLIDGDTNGVSDVFIKDLTTGETIRVSTDSMGSQQLQDAYVGSFSPDGGSVSVGYLAPNFTLDIVVKNLSSGVATRIGQNTYGGQFSPDALSFVSAGAVPLASNDLNNSSDVYVQSLTTPSDDLLFGRRGNDTLRGLDGDDTLNGGLGNDRLEGGFGSDTASYSGRTWNVQANLATGRVQIGTNEIDTLISVENLIGGLGRDTLLGDLGDNELDGGGGADTLNGGGGDDLVRGGNGADRLDGGVGRDSLTGGAGADRFAVTQAGLANTDVITDFSRPDGDVIDLSSLDANVTAAGNQVFRYIGAREFSNVAGQLRWESDGVDVSVQVDVDGDGQADTAVIVLGRTSLLATDFIL